MTSWTHHGDRYVCSTMDGDGCNTPAREEFGVAKDEEEDFCACVLMGEWAEKGLFWKVVLWSGSPMGGAAERRRDPLRQAALPWTRMAGWRGVFSLFLQRTQSNFSTRRTAGNAKLARPFGEHQRSAASATWVGKAITYPGFPTRGPIQSQGLCSSQSSRNDKRQD